MEGWPEYKESTTIIQAGKDIEQGVKWKLGPPPIQMKEMKKIRKYLKTSKIANPDNIRDKAIIEASDETLNIYNENRNRLLWDNDIPQNWQQWEIITIYKWK